METEYKIDIESLDGIEDEISNSDDRYNLDELSGNGGFFTNAFISNPKNDQPEVVAMKMALVDVTNSTNLNRILGKKDYYSKGKHIVRNMFSFSELINRVVSMPDFDERLARGDASLVSELTRWGDTWGEKESDGANMMSFFSKYCLYQNYIIYGRDDYSIYDSVVKDNIGKYLTDEEVKKLFPGIKIRTTKKFPDATSARGHAVALQIEKWKKTYNYEAFNDLMTKILEMRGIPTDSDKRYRRKLDLLVWHRGRLSAPQKS